MKRFAWIVPVLAGLWGCSGGDGGKPGCEGAGSCGAGSYCAQTPDGNVCWPDAVGPVVSDVHAVCSDSPCLRTSTLRVTATVTDDAAVGGATATLDIDPTHPLAMQAGAGGVWQVDVPLAPVPFPFFEHGVAVSVVGTDEAKNATQPQAASEQPNVTRLAWTRSLKGATPLSLWSPAVLRDGRTVVAASDGKVYFVAKDGLSSSATTVSASALSGPVAVGSDAIWVGSEDGTLYSVGLGGATAKSCSAGESVIGAPAVFGAKAAVVTSGTYVVVADSTSVCVPAVLLSPGQPVVNASGSLLVPNSGKLGSFTVRANGALQSQWTLMPSIGDVAVPPAIDGLDSVWTTAVTGPVFRTDSAGSADQIAQMVSGNSAGAIILEDGTALIGDRSSTVLRRLSAGTLPPWTTSAVVTGPPVLPMALSGASRSILVPTSLGYLFLLDESDGAVIWSHRVTSSNHPLQPPNIWTEPGATTSTAYLAGADGVLYAVIVDGALDTSAPWPKAYHDPQNTSNAGYAP